MKSKQDNGKMNLNRMLKMYTPAQKSKEVKYNDNVENT